jgi:hypothetical protein
MDEYLKGHAIAHPTEAFDPDAIRVLTTAFEHAWRNLESSGIRFDSDHQFEARQILARYIIEQARQGERDDRRLRDGALLQFSRANFLISSRK